MTKYKDYFQRMLTANQQLFASFQEIHDAYALNPTSLQAKFNHEGGKILKIIRQWENMLCRQSEKGGYGIYTAKLAEKFKEEIKKKFPMIDSVGLIINHSQSLQERSFSLKKINLENRL